MLDVSIFCQTCVSRIFLYSTEDAGGFDSVDEAGTEEGGGGGGAGGDDWGAWDSWQSCTVTCGDGVRMRYRECVIDSCLGEDVDSEDCFADELCEGRCNDTFKSRHASFCTCMSEAEVESFNPLD